jgi:hypothetical protein
MTRAMRSALLWFRNRGGDGVFAKDGVFLCAGERAPIMRSTWNRLCDAGFIGQPAKRRLRITEIGLQFDLTNVRESE